MWLAWNPDRRLAYNGDHICRYEPDLMTIAPGGWTAAAVQLQKSDYLTPDDAGWWKISKQGQGEGRVRIDLRLEREETAHGLLLFVADARTTQTTLTSEPGPGSRIEPEPAPERRTVPEGKRCRYERLDGTPCRAWAKSGSEPLRCPSHTVETLARKAKLKVKLKVKPVVKKKVKAGPLIIPLIPRRPAEIPEKPRQPKLRKLPKMRPTSEPSAADPCQPHSIKFCPACEESRELDKLCGQRLRRAARQAAKLREVDS